MFLFAKSNIVSLSIRGCAAQFNQSLIIGRGLKNEAETKKSS
jgi:hypothetical protein